jgi:NADH:ubiquinone oxidoreductase subunit 6 (subunit J)
MSTTATATAAPTTSSISRTWQIVIVVTLIFLTFAASCWAYYRKYTSDINYKNAAKSTAKNIREQAITFFGNWYSMPISCILE